MKRMLYGFVLLGLLLASQLPATAAKKSSKLVVFQATGEFESGDVLTGTVTIETTTGTVGWANLAVVDAGNNIVAAFSGVPSTNTNGAGDVEIGLLGGTSFYAPGILLVIPSTSLKKYAGGSLVAYDSRWWWWPTIQFSQTDHLVGGTLEP